jgi:uncharacterized coiled-coil DUF342 family protein
MLHDNCNSKGIHYIPKVDSDGDFIDKDKEELATFFTTLQYRYSSEYANELIQVIHQLARERKDINENFKEIRGRYSELYATVNGNMFNVGSSHRKKIELLEERIVQLEKPKKKWWQICK